MNPIIEFINKHLKTVAELKLKELIGLFTQLNDSVKDTTKTFQDTCSIINKSDELLEILTEERKEALTSLHHLRVGSYDEENEILKILDNTNLMINKHSIKQEKDNQTLSDLLMLIERTNKQISIIKDLIIDATVDLIKYL